MNAVLDPPRPVSAAPRVVTAEDLLLMGDEGKRYELVDGQLEELSVSFLSSFVAGRVYKALDRYIDSGHAGWLVPEGTSFQCFPEDRSRVRRADSAFFALDRITREQAVTEGHCTVCPDLVVEVISPNDLAVDVILKVKEWLGAGARLVWLIDPETKVVHCHDREQPSAITIRRDGETLTGDPVLPGLAVPVAELFRLPVASPT
ncbi:MAG TPA: Uma2 family endonuclease [Gemmataceae bacterium]|jgi:Uma2 family endonuclease